MAPFRCVGVTKNVYSAAPGHSQPGGMCDYCGTGIMYEYRIVSADGRKFVVGSDCVDKVDAKLSRQVKAVRAAYRTPEQIAAAAAYNAEKAAREAARKVQDDARQAAREAEMRQAELDNAELIRVFSKLSEAGGQFICDMYGALMTTPFAQFSPRQRACICDIYAKTFGRSGSKAYNAAYDVAAAHDTTPE